MILELLLDALLDSVKNAAPFLFAAYWLIEYVEHRHSEGIEKALAGGGRFGFVPGAVLGLLPQCGFFGHGGKPVRQQRWSRWVPCWRCSLPRPTRRCRCSSQTRNTGGRWR